ncbi:hypothetical protein FO519_002892 [Halicephalobus sp. NKZ332]|nr:hypothetical protein FO519_002892 [Halicephalobus sp. NKZ332]
MTQYSVKDDEWRVALRQVIESLAKRNTAHKKFPELQDRTSEMDKMILDLRQLLGKNEVEAAQLHVKCISYIDETDKILNSKVPSYHSRSTSPCRVNPIYSSEVINSWRPDDLNSKNTNNGADDYNQLYGDYRSKWWRVLCLNAGKEAKQKQQTENIRDLWNNQIEFFLSCLGFIVGVGNTLRFPSMVYQHGGVFFIPYIICLILFGMPLVYMHLAIGQYTGLSASGAFWKMMPLASGIGWGLVLLAVPVSIYYNIIVAWSVYYFWYSVEGFFTSTDLPWTDCHEVHARTFNCCEILNANSTCYNNPFSMTSTEAYFHYVVLNRTEIHNPVMGDIQTNLVICLAAAWILVFFGVFKGIGSIGWAMYLTATIPYLLLIILLLRGISLPGAKEGIQFFFYPDISKLWSLGMWKSAAEQVFYSLGIDAGPLISMASFSRYRNNIYRDASLLVLLDTLTSILCGMVIFSFIGFLSTVQGKPLTDILKHDSLYLAFTVYPSVPAYMEWGALWAALFFAMMVLSAIDAEFAWLEMIASSIMNQFGSKEKFLENRLLGILCLCFFICGIPLCARGGIFIFHSIENLNANWNSFSLSLIQIIIVCYIYGASNFLKDIGEMLRIESEPNKVYNTKLEKFWKKTKIFFGPTGSYIKWTWCFFSPLIISALLVASIFRYERVHFSTITLPWPYELVAWIVMIGPLFVVPFTCGYTIYEAYRRGKPLRSVIDCGNWRHKPKEEEQKQPKHQIEIENDYMYIDPISRGASAKSQKMMGIQMDILTPGEDSYSRFDEKIREWNSRSGRSEPYKTIELATVEEIEMTRNKIPDTPESVYSDDRVAGRIKDWVSNNPSERTTLSEDKEPQRPYFTDYRKTPSQSSHSDSDLNLFGPPPVLEGFENSRAETIKYRNSKRLPRGSDQKRNKIFEDTFNFNYIAPVIVEQASTPSPKPTDSDETFPRTDTVRYRHSSESPKTMNFDDAFSRKDTVRNRYNSESPRGIDFDEALPRTSTVRNRYNSGSPNILDADEAPERISAVRNLRSSDSNADLMSTGSLSITPIDFSARSISDVSDSQFLRPQRPKPPKLKRPKPIDYPRSSTSSKEHN